MEQGFSVMAEKFILVLFFLSSTLLGQTLERDLTKNLIEKGYQILAQIQNREPPNHRIESFPDSASKTNPYWVSSIPTLRQVLQWKTEHPQEDQDRKAYLESMICVLWALDDHAKNKNQGFQSGAFSVKDDDELLYQFFLGYLSVCGYESIQDLPYGPYNSANMAGDPFVYNRHPKGGWVKGSSHYTRKTLAQIGIDIRFEEKGWTLPLLPHGMKHLIVGRIAGDGILPAKTFIKWEEEGSGDLTSTLTHLGYYSYSLFSRKDRRSEKDIPNENGLKEAYLRFLDQVEKDRYGSYSKLPADQKNLFSIPKEDLELGHVARMAQLAIYNPRMSISSNGNPFPWLRIHGAHFLNMLQASFQDGIEISYDDFMGWEYILDEKVFYRTGNEVVLDLKEVVLPQ